MFCDHPLLTANRGVHSLKVCVTFGTPESGVETLGRAEPFAEYARRNRAAGERTLSEARLPGEVNYAGRTFDCILVRFERSLAAQTTAWTV